MSSTSKEATGIPTLTDMKKPLVGDPRWDGGVVRALFSDPQLYGARRLLARADADVAAHLQAGRLQLIVKLEGRSYFGSVAMKSLTPRGKGFQSNCSCGAAQPCVHIVAGYLLASADARHMRADDVLVELIGLGTDDAPGDVTAAAEPGTLTPDTRKWLAAFPPVAAAGHGTAHATLAFVLESSVLNGPVLDQVSAFVVEDGRRRRVPLVELAADPALDRPIQRSCALLLAAGAARPGEVWGPQAVPALLDLAQDGRLRVAGDDGDLSVGAPDDARVYWERDGEMCRVIVGTRHEVRRVVDADPALYVDAHRRIGVFRGVSARAWAWLRRAPVVPVAATDAFQAAVAARPEIATVLPPMPMLEVAEVPAGEFEPQVLLTGQVSTARAVLSFRYGKVHVTEPGLPIDFRQFVDGGWLLAHRDHDAEDACLQRLVNAGLQSEEGAKWRLFLPPQFAESTKHQWMRLQRGLLNDVQFDDNWRVVIEDDFGYKPDIVAKKETADTGRRFNRKRS